MVQTPGSAVLDEFDNLPTFPVSPGSVSRRIALTAILSAVLPVLEQCAEGKPVENPPGFGLFVELSGMRVPAGVKRVRSSGYSRPGLGNGWYAHDWAVDATYVAAHSRCAFLTSDGRGFRLISRVLQPEQLGAIGDGIANDQAPFQAALDYAAVAGIRTIELPSDRYRIHCTHRVTPYSNDGDYHRTYDGHPLVMPLAPLALMSRHSRGTDLNIYNPDGSSREQSKWQILDNGKAVWRGGGIFVRGLRDKPADKAFLPSLSMTGIRLNGGIPRGAFYGTVRPSDGDGWDVSDKGIWYEADYWTGDLTLIHCSVTGFRGELIFGGNLNNDARWTLRTVALGESNGDLLNPSGPILDVDGLYGFRGYSALEGWTGAHGRIVNAKFVDCITGGNIQGGRPPRGRAKGYYIPTPVVDGQIPWGRLDLEFINCTHFAPGSWTDSRIRAVDTTIAVAGGEEFIYGLQDVRLSIFARNENNSLAYLTITGRPEVGAQAVRNVHVIINYGQSQKAIEQDKQVGTPIGWYGSIGPDVSIEASTGTAQGAPRALSTVPDYHPTFRRDSFHSATPLTHDVTAFPMIPPEGDRIMLTAPVAAAYLVRMQTDCVGDGHDMTLIASGPPGTTYALSQADAGLRLRANSRILEIGGKIVLRFSASGEVWEEIAFCPTA